MVSWGRVRAGDHTPEARLARVLDAQSVIARVAASLGPIHCRGNAMTTEQHRLAAIVSADVAGYSQLMGAADWRPCQLSRDERTSIARGTFVGIC